MKYENCYNFQSESGFVCPLEEVVVGVEINRKGRGVEIGRLFKAEIN